jgi:hypothetical protein
MTKLSEPPRVTASSRHRAGSLPRRTRRATKRVYRDNTVAVHAPNNPRPAFLSELSRRLHWLLALPHGQAGWWTKENYTRIEQAKRELEGGQGTRFDTDEAFSEALRARGKSS